MLLLLLLVLLALLVLVVGMAAIVMVIARHQKQSIAYDNQIVPGMPSNAPPSWAGSHDPEARLHRRLRDAIRSLHAVNVYDTASSVNLRAGLEQSALAVDNHLIGIATLPPAHRDQALPDATAAVEAIESGVAQYVSATTKPDPVAFEAGLQGVQTSIDVATRQITALSPNPPFPGNHPDPSGARAPQPLQPPDAAFPPANAYPQPPTGTTPQSPPSGGFAQPHSSGGYPQPPSAHPGTPPPQPGNTPPQSSSTPPNSGDAPPPGPDPSDPTIIRRQP